MRKKLIILLIVSFIFSLGLMGCSEKKAEKNEVSGNVQLKIITGSTGGTYYSLGGAIANVWSKYIDGIQVTSQPGGASVESINSIVTGEVEIGLAMNNIADDAWNGRGKFANPIQDFRVIGVVYPEVFQGIALKGSGVKTIEDLKDKKVAVGPPGSGTAVLSEIVLEEAGITFNDIRAEFAGFGDASNKMKDGLIDASMGVLSVPAAAVQDIITVRDIEIIEVEDELYEKIKKKYPFFNKYIIEAGTYGNEEDIQTINCQAALYCSADLSEDIVYELTKVLYEKSSEIGNAHAAGKWINVENALAGITTKLHPGALKYYEELGLVIAEEIK